MIVIATDADVDGMHIRLLLMTFFLQFFPDLVKNNHLYILQTPLFRLRNKKETIYCYSEPERIAAIDKIGKSAEITRFKGLGEIDRSAWGLPHNHAYIARYLARTGFAPPESWTFFFVFAHFRFLAILQGVLARGLQGNAANPLGSSETRSAVEWLAEEGRRVALNGVKLG